MKGVGWDGLAFSTQEYSYYYTIHTDLAHMVNITYNNTNTYYLPTYYFTVYSLYDPCWTETLFITGLIDSLGTKDGGTIGRRQ